MEKVIRDGKVAVLYSPGYGAGWYSWHRIPELIFHPELVKLVEENRRGEITEEFCLSLLKSNKPENGIYCGGAYFLEIKWINEGQEFEIIEDSIGNEYCHEVYLSNYLKA